MWSPKGGVGLSVTAAATAAVFARRDGSSVLVDLCGDQPALLGLADPTGPGVFDWLASEGASTESLSRLLIDGPAGIALLPAGHTSEVRPGRVAELIGGLGALATSVVIDAGVNPGLPQETSQEVPSTFDQRRAELIGSLMNAGRSILVSSSCYLALRRAVRLSSMAGGLVVVAEPGRALGSGDISELLGLRLLAEVDRDPAVARSVDAGMFLRRPARGVEHALKNLVVAS